MPTVSRLKFVNVGHHNAFFNDLIIDARRWNANTFVLAANGVGKSSLIGLVFSLLRPYSYDFPYGEGQKKKRELSDYIPADSPSHVIIEWILDNQNTFNNLRYLVTGMVIERNAKNIDSLYYSYEYNQLREADEKSIADIPIYNEKDTFNSLKNIRGFLRDLKDKNPRQKVNYTEVKKAWLDILDYYYIDPELYRVQATMNQREGNQASIMDFRDSPEFINRLIELITPLDNLEEVESTIQSIKSHYTEVKNLPKYKEENAFLQNIIPKLKV